MTKPRPQAPPDFSMLYAEKWESLVHEITYGTSWYGQNNERWEA